MRAREEKIERAHGKRKRPRDDTEGNQKSRRDSNLALSASPPATRAPVAEALVPGLSKPLTIAPQQPA